MASSVCLDFFKIWVVLMMVRMRSLSLVSDIVFLIIEPKQAINNTLLLFESSGVKTFCFDQREAQWSSVQTIIVLVLKAVSYEVFV